MSVEIYIARHGQNVGRDQAKELGEAIAASDLSFDTIYSSPLSRAYETAEIVAEIIKLPKPIVYDQLIERNFGVMTGEPASRVEELCAPDIIKTDTITYMLSPEGAETFPQLIKRGQEVLEYVRSHHDHGKVLLVCHGDIGKMIYCAATSKDWQDVLVDFHFGNGELIDVSGEGEAQKIKLTQYNH
jgi:broad specificity phosphatase PhoE